MLESGRSHVNTVVILRLNHQVTLRRSAVVENGKNANVHERRRNEIGNEENGGQDPDPFEATATRKMTGKKGEDEQVEQEMTAKNAQEVGKGAHEGVELARRVLLSVPLLVKSMKMNGLRNLPLLLSLLLPTVEALAWDHLPSPLLL